MTKESAREAQGGGYASGPTGLRRLTPSLLRADRMAESFAGLPDGVTVPGQLLTAFKASAPRRVPLCPPPLSVAVEVTMRVMGRLLMCCGRETVALRPRDGLRRSGPCRGRGVPASSQRIGCSAAGAMEQRARPMAAADLGRQHFHLLVLRGLPDDPK